MQKPTEKPLKERLQDSRCESDHVTVTSLLLVQPTVTGSAIAFITVIKTTAGE